MNFIKEQLEKEKHAAKKVWKISLKGLSIYWGLLGLFILFSPGWPVGIALIASALYVNQRTGTGAEIDSTK